MFGTIFGLLDLGTMKGKKLSFVVGGVKGFSFEIIQLIFISALTCVSIMCFIDELKNQFPFAKIVGLV